MLNGNDATDEQKQEKISMLKYTYEQILASQAEQVNSKANNLDNLKGIANFERGYSKWVFYILLLFLFAQNFYTGLLFVSPFIIKDGTFLKNIIDK